MKGLGAKPGAVAAAALTEDNKLIQTKQYKHPMRKAIYDLPAGECMKVKHQCKQPYGSYKRKQGTLQINLNALEDLVGHLTI